MNPLSGSIYQVYEKHRNTGLTVNKYSPEKVLHSHYLLGKRYPPVIIYWGIHYLPEVNVN